MQIRRFFPALIVALPASLLWLYPNSSEAQTNYQRILSFDALPASGRLPRGQLLEASDGWLYGTTTSGGASGAGTLFKIAKNGTGFSPVYSFPAGSSPFGSLIELGDGTLCGTASGDATHSGAVFKLNKDGSGFTRLRTFPATGTDGTRPTGSLVTGKQGYFYGVTFGGGNSNKGTIFRMKTDGGSYSILHNFGEPGDGASPFAGLCMTAGDILYGTTQAGGSNDMGVAFQMKVDGSGYAVVHHFNGSAASVPDGQLPLGRLVLGSDGFLYGTTFLGGSNNLGTVFKLGTSGSYTVIKHFAGGTEGNQPFAGLVQGTNGLLYGTARYGGAGGGGTVFTLTTNGSAYAVLHDFPAAQGDGSQPLASLLRGSDGSFYGTTYWGGQNATNGTLFKLSTSLPSVVVITNITSASGAYVISFAGGAAGQSYQVMATTNRLDQGWVDLGSATAVADGTFQFTDSTATNYPMRFYRSRLP